MRSALVVLLMMGGAASAEECGGTLLHLTEWNVQIVERSGMEAAQLSLTYESGAEKPFRLIDASVRFADALGGRIGSVAVERDLRLSPGATVSEEQTYLGTQLNRIPGMEREDVEATVCVRAVVYDDGTRETF